MWVADDPSGASDRSPRVRRDHLTDRIGQGRVACNWRLWLVLHAEIQIHDAEPDRMIRNKAPELLKPHDISTLTGAEMLIRVGDNPDRIRTVAAYAELCGVCPKPASNGKTSRMRLNRSGSRQAMPRSTASPSCACALTTKRKPMRPGERQNPARDRALPQTIHRASGIQRALQAKVAADCRLANMGAATRWPRPSTIPGLGRPHQGRGSPSCVQSRCHPSSRPMTQPHSRGIRNHRAAGPLQQPQPAQPPREHPACGSRSNLRRNSANGSHGRATDVNQPPPNPARFSPLRGLTSVWAGHRRSAPENADVARLVLRVISLLGPPRNDAQNQSLTGLDLEIAGP